MNTKQLVAWVLVVGAVNWGLVGLLDLNIVETIFGGSSSMLTRAVYIVVGLAGAYKAYMLVTVKK
ncbi:MAG: DUF378 domain-containing protein [Candidatus Daviesbacteria bacterium]|nr:DUF378 domain-containing protein [Candidatus Daviesbacteria bacterium]